MSALDDFFHEVEKHAVMRAHGTLFLDARIEVAYLRATLAEKKAEITEWRGIVEMERDHYEDTLNNPGAQGQYRIIRAFLAAHPAEPKP